MADLTKDLGLVTAPALKPLAAAKARGTEDKVSTGHLGEVKDQVASETSIPLSPQWLYAKTGDYKAALSAAPVDNRSSNFLPHGTSVDSTQRDARRPEGLHDKKEWRRNLPDVENSRRWHDEERETGLLGRRERRKEGDRENEYRKIDRRPEIVSMRDAADPRSLPSSDRWNEVPGRNSGYENRRDSKWSSRWGPEDKEKDPRVEKRTDGDKEDTHAEKQSVIGGSRPMPESESRDKWKPRHRQESHSSGTAVYRAAPGFGTERGRVEGPIVGFAPGRGRSKFVGSPTLGGSSSSAPLGAVPAIMTGSLVGKSSISVNTFCYPRAKILDIYRKNKMTPSPCDSTGFVEVPQITQPSSLPPLAFVKPDSEGTEVLEYIWKGKVKSSEDCDSHTGKSMGTVSACKIEPNFDVGECEDMIDTMSTSKDPAGVTLIFLKDDAFSNAPDSLRKADKANVNNSDEFVRLPDFLDSKMAALNSPPKDIVTKLPGDSNSLFSTSFIQETLGSDGQHQDNHKRELEEQTVDLSLFYQDPQGEIQGPFLVVDILSWCDQGYFGSDLPVRLLDAPEGTEFQSLGELMSNLSLRSQVTCPVNRVEQTEHSDDTRGNLEANASILFTLNDEVLHPSGRDDPFNQTQQRLHEVSSQMPQFSQPEIFGGVADAERHEFSVQDAEEVLYMGRTVNSTQTSGKLASDIRDLPQTFNNNQGLQTGHPNFMNYKVPTDDDSNPLGLSWSELEGTHHKGPLSSITAGHGNHDNVINPVLGGDASLFRHGNHDNVINPVLGGDASVFRHNQDKFSVHNDFVVHDAWPGNGRRNASSNILHDAFDGSLSHFESDINNLTNEDHFLSQNFQKQHLKQQHLMPCHQNQQFNASYLDQLHGPSHQQQSMIRREHMLKLQFERQQRLQQLEQEEQLHQQHQLHRRMQLLQQQHRQQQQQQHQQRQQHQLLLEQLLHHKLQDANYGVPHVDPLLGENSIDHILYRQQLIHEPSLDQLIQAKLGHNLQHQNELLETLNHPSNRHMLTLEQQYLLDLQQEQVQSRRFPIASRQQPVMDEEKHVGGAWSIDESGQFISAPVGHHTWSGRPSQLDFVQPLQRNSSFEQPAHLDRNFLLHDRIQKGNFGLNSQSFEGAAGTPRPDMDIMSTFARLQGMDLQERYGRTNSPGQMGQLSGNRPLQNWMANQIHAPHLDAMERNWSEASGQLQNNLTESQFARLHLAMEKQNREVLPDLSFEDWNQRQSLDRNNEILNYGPAEVLRQKLRLQSSQQLGLADGTLTSSYDNRDPSWLFPQPVIDDSLNSNSDNIGLAESSMEGSFFTKLGQTPQGVPASLTSEGRANIYETGRRTPFRSGSGASSEHKQFFANIEEIENSQLAHSKGVDMSRERVDISDLKDGVRVKQHGSKILALNKSDLDSLEGGRIDQAEVYVDHGALKNKIPVRHASFGVAGGGTNLYNYDMRSDSAYVDPMANDRMSGIFVRNSDGSLMRPHPLSSQGVSSELVKGLNSDSFAYSDEMRHEGGGHSESSSSGKDLVRFRRTSSCSDTDAAPEASFMDMLKGNRKQIPAETDVAAESSDVGGSGGKTNKKKGKKGRQIDPSLLGFKVHSNRIMMGEIQRPE